MPKPVKAVYREDKSATELFFKEQVPKEDPDEPDDPGELFYVVGSIVFPEGVGKQGYALIGGQKTEDKKVWIFEEQPFISVKAINPPDSGNKTYTDLGLASFLSMAWKQYHCRKFYVADVDLERVRLYQKEIMRDKLINPKPLVVFVPYADDKDTSENLVLDFIRNKLILIDRGSNLFSRLKDLTDGRDYKLMVQQPSVQAVPALKVLLSGFAFSPWKMPVKNDLFKNARSSW